MMAGNPVELAQVSEEMAHHEGKRGVPVRAYVVYKYRTRNCSKVSAMECEIQQSRPLGHKHI